MPITSTKPNSGPVEPRTLAEIIENKKELLEHAKKKRETGSESYSSSKLIHMDAFITELTSTIDELADIRAKMSKAWENREA
ncbi:hypothetical protein MLD52_00130 [Puniceicoccaceae bacterium K14]|nr:hypothetical protein [Puniceicoccaceae bacterium K14]